MVKSVCKRDIKRKTQEIKIKNLLKRKSSRCLKQFVFHSTKRKSLLKDDWKIKVEIIQSSSETKDSTNEDKGEFIQRVISTYLVLNVIRCKNKYRNEN